jgi:hypothetical protein
VVEIILPSEIVAMTSCSSMLGGVVTPSTLANHRAAKDPTRRFVTTVMPRSPPFMASRGSTSRLLPWSYFDATSWHARPVVTVVAAVVVHTDGPALAWHARLVSRDWAAPREGGERFERVARCAARPRDALPRVQRHVERVTGHVRRRHQ